MTKETTTNRGVGMLNKLTEGLKDMFNEWGTLRKDVTLLDQRLGDEVNKGHALYRRVGELEQEIRRALTIEDLRKTNVTISLMEKDIKELYERLNLAENDIEKALGAKEQMLTKEQVPDAHQREMIKALGKAWGLVNQGWVKGVEKKPLDPDIACSIYCSYSLLGALKEVSTDPTMLRDLVRAIYDVIQFIYPWHPQSSDFDKSCQLIEEWNDGVAVWKSVNEVFRVAWMRASYV